jgi:hypothetical protein
MNLNRFFKIISVSVIMFSCNSQEEKPKADEQPVAEEKKSSGWQTLSDGTRNQWHTYGHDSMGSAWKVEDSIIHLDASVKNDWQTKNGGDIVSNQEYENFDLELDWKISPAGNSGIMIYVHEDSSKYKYPWETGMEMQVVDNEKHPDGKIPKHQAGELYDLIPINKKPFKPVGEWNHIRILSDKGALEFYVNNEQVLKTTLWDDNWKKLIAGSKFNEMKDFGTYKKGRISLQDHGADVWFKNVRIKEL